MAPKYQDPEKTVFVSNVGEKITEELLWELFLQAGPLHNVHIPTDRNSKKNKTFAFITFQHACSVLYACELFNTLKLFERPIYCKPSIDSSKSDNQKPLNTGSPSYSTPVPSGHNQQQNMNRNTTYEREQSGNKQNKEKSFDRTPYDEERNDIYNRDDRNYNRDDRTFNRNERNGRNFSRNDSDQSPSGRYGNQNQDRDYSTYDSRKNDHRRNSYHDDRNNHQRHDGNRDYYNHGGNNRHPNHSTQNGPSSSMMMQAMSNYHQQQYQPRRNNQNYFDNSDNHGPMRNDPSQRHGRNNRRSRPY